MNINYVKHALNNNVIFCAGVWFWHCHLDHHLSIGMATVMIVKNGDSAEKSIRKPPANMPECVDDPRFKLWKSDY